MNIVIVLVIVESSEFANDYHNCSRYNFKFMSRSGRASLQKPAISFAVQVLAEQS